MRVHPALVRRLLRDLEEHDLVIYRRRRWLRRVVNGRRMQCIAFYDGEGRIELALRGHTSADDLIHSVLHELLHGLGLGESVTDGFDQVVYTNRTLRDAVARRLLNELCFNPRIS
jgi:hypothetical protein